MKHTPGPWHDISDSSRTRDKRRMALVNTGAGSAAIDCTHSGESFAEDCANARLIAAAPDLLEALRDLEFALLHDLDLPEPRRAALAAIAKAEGA